MEEKNETRLLFIKKKTVRFSRELLDIYLFFWKIRY